VKLESSFEVPGLRADHEALGNNALVWLARLPTRRSMSICGPRRQVFGDCLQELQDVLRSPSFCPRNIGGRAVSFDRERAYRSDSASGRNTTLRAFTHFPALRRAVRKPFGISNAQTLHVTLLLFCCVRIRPIYIDLGILPSEVSAEIEDAGIT